MELWPDTSNGKVQLVGGQKSLITWGWAFPDQLGMASVRRASQEVGLGPWVMPARPPDLHPARTVSNNFS